MLRNRFARSHGYSPATAALAPAVLAGLLFPTMAAAGPVKNGDFSATAAAYTAFPGYSASPNPADPTGWIGTSGVNGPDTGFYHKKSDNLPFAPTSSTINGNLPDFAFMQAPGASVTQTVATTSGSNYTLTYCGAARAGLKFIKL